MFSNYQVFLWIFRLLLLMVAISLIFIANVPAKTFSIGFGSDTLNHAAAFAVLTPLLLFSFPHARLIWLIGGLLGFNALIEVSQGLLSLGREPEVKDWLVGAVVSSAILTLLWQKCIFRIPKSRLW